MIDVCFVSDFLERRLYRRRAEALHTQRVAVSSGEMDRIYYSDNNIAFYQDLGDTCLPAPVLVDENGKAVACEVLLYLYQQGQQPDQLIPALASVFTVLERPTFAAAWLIMVDDSLYRSDVFVVDHGCWHRPTYSMLWLHPLEPQCERLVL